ncbi:hypothetical protein C0995_009919 [Termitomyces sp. Mi166|nr:hypothetical protein C0995_009919 [Termitomyces sp. Mi166\
MAGTGNSTPQMGDAGVIPVPQAGETPEASVYRPLHKQEKSDTQNVSASVGILPSLVYPDPSDFIGQRWSSVESLPQQQGVVTKESTQKHLQLYVLKHMQMLANMGQRVPEVESTEYIELYLQIFELELEEYMKRKEACATARSTATLADSVDYNAIRHQQVPVITEVMDALNAPQQAEESQQDFERHQNAAR